MSNILQAKVTIKGTRPLFYHRFGPDAIPLEKLEKTGVPGNDPEEWRKTVMVTEEGQLFLEPTYIFATIREGSKFVKKGRGSIQTSMIATLQIMDTRVLVDRFMPGYPNGKAYDVAKENPPAQDPFAPVYLDIRMVRNPTSKMANIRYRVVASPGWSCSFTLEWDKTIVSRGEMESALIDSGKLVGIGNGRKIGMGRFEVASFEVVE